ncbi:ISAs1 family transposase [Streptomyces phaeochromogenes]|uniref:ISAs1 family transposase n=1 Tax=Streptomyces phaeochromogenes TaxID=1923 RepID=UPI000A75F782|nr:ISAs1 family transposase [Streptomyces phaeochromogenes]
MAKNAPQEALARLGARTTSVFAVRVAPSTATVRRIINATCSGGLADLLGADPAGSDTLAVGGKSARGSRSGDSPAAHLLAAMTGAGTAVTQLRAPDKTNEITCFAALLEPYDPSGVTVAADALHTQRAHARFLVEEKRAHYAFTVKMNQPILYAQLKTLPWDKATAKFYDRSHGHVRLETRVVQVLTVTALGIDFPHAAQVAKIVRHRTCAKTGRRTRETVYVLTDLTSRQASPERLAKIVRSQWTIDMRQWRRRARPDSRKRVLPNGSPSGHLYGAEPSEGTPWNQVGRYMLLLHDQLRAEEVGHGDERGRPSQAVERTSAGWVP